MNYSPDNTLNVLPSTPRKPGMFLFLDNYPLMNCGWVKNPDLALCSAVNLCHFSAHNTDIDNRSTTLRVTDERAARVPLQTVFHVSLAGTVATAPGPLRTSVSVTEMSCGCPGV